MTIEVFFRDRDILRHFRSDILLTEILSRLARGYNATVEYWREPTYGGGGTRIRITERSHDD